MNLMHQVFETLLVVLESHFGALAAVAFAIYLVIAYAKGELQDFFAFIKDTLTDAKTGHASTKNMGYLMGAVTICWGFVKITLATCRRIDSPTNPLDPTMILLTELGVIATLVGVMYLGGKALQDRIKAGEALPPADPGSGGPV